MTKGKNQFAARLENQKAQLERNGYSAEVVVRTTPEATDMINFARLWEHVIVQADRRTRGYMAKSSRDDFEKTQRAFRESVDYMMKRMKEEIDRHDIDMGGANFVSRIAQRYNLTDKKAPVREPRAPKAAATEEKAEKVEKAAKAPKADAQESEVEGL
jgi:septin family protein